MGTWGRTVAEISGAKESTGHIGDKGTKAWGTRLGSPWHTVTVGMAFVAAASRGLIALLEGTSLCSHFMQHRCLKNVLCLALLFNLLSIPAKIADGLASKLKV